MKSPQLENGYTKIANEILEALASTQLSGYQTRCLFFLLRKTYGWKGKKCDIISLSQWVEGTGIAKSHLCRTLNELKARNIVAKNGNKWSFNKYYTTWRALPKMVTKVALPKMAIPVTKNGNIGVPKMAHTKEKKETTTKERKTKGNGVSQKIKDYAIILKFKNIENADHELVSKYAWTGENWQDFRLRIYREYEKLRAAQ